MKTQKVSDERFPVAPEIGIAAAVLAVIGMEDDDYGDLNDHPGSLDLPGRMSGCCRFCGHQKARERKIEKWR